MNMNMNMFFIPSFYAHMLNGFILLIAIVFFLFHYKKLTNLEPYKLVLLIFIFSIAVGVHSLSHLGLETVYNFNPLLIKL